MSRIRSRDTKPELLVRKFLFAIHPFNCEIVSGEITLHEHSAMICLPIKELHTLDWAEADWPVIEKYQKQFDRINA